MIIHLRVAAQVAVQHHGVRAAAELVDQRAQDFGGGCVFERHWHALDLAVGMNDDVQVDGRVVVGRKCLGQSSVNGLWV